MREKLTFTKHVLERMWQRGVSEQDVRETIENFNHKTAIQEDNTQEFKRKSGSKEYYVIVEHKKNSLIVITAGCNNA